MLVSNDLDRQLERHRNETIQAIQAGRTEVVKRRINAYVKFVRAFVESRRNLGVKYTPDQARRVSSLDWPLLRHLESNLYRIIEAAVQSEQRDMVVESLAAPLHLLKLSVELGDYLIFHRVVRLYPVLLRLSFTSASPEFRQFVRDGCWRYLKEFEEFYLVSRLTREKDGSSPEELKPYFDDVYDAFGDMLKVCVDSSDAAALAEVGGAFDRLADGIVRGPANEELERLYQELSRTREVIWFGTGAWLSKLYEESSVGPPGEARRQPRGVDPTTIAKMLHEVSHRFGSLGDLSSVYLRCLKWEPSMRSWEHWILQELPEGEAHAIDFSRWLTLFYCVQGARLTPIDISAAADTIPAVSPLKDRLNEIEATISRIRQHRSIWESVVPPETLEDSRLDSFLSLVSRAAERYQERREDAIISARISPHKVEEFRRKVLDGWERYAWLRKLIARFGTIETKGPSQIATKERFGIHTLYPKEPFLEEQEAVYVGFGESEGRTLGLGESNRVLKSWLDATGLEATRASVTNASEAMEGTIASLRSRGCEPSVIVVRCAHELLEALHQQGKFIAQWHRDCPQMDIEFFQGVFQQLPVFCQFTDETCSALVLDLKKFGTWVDYEIVAQEPRTVEVSVEQLDEERLTKILEANPQEDRRKLLQRIVVKVLELFEFQIQDPTAAVRIDFAEGDRSS